MTWETHSHPELGDRPQAILNKQIFRSADLLVGIFWTRIGTPTGEAESGTVEEIREHVKTGKPAMIYFSKQPVVPGSIDQDQYQRLKTFIDECKTEGLLFEYDSFSQFRQYFYKHLVRTINENEYFATKSEGGKIALEEELVHSTDNEVTLSKEAQELLIEAANSPDGRVMKLRTSQGLTISTNKKGFVSKKDARLEATWEDAVNQLRENGFIEDKGYKGEVFAVTRLGYEYADRLMKGGG